MEIIALLFLVLIGGVVVRLAFKVLKWAVFAVVGILFLVVVAVMMALSAGIHP